jgi:hypothetical protein
MGGTARAHWPCPMGGTARKFSLCAVSWADGLAHGTARHGTGRHGDTGGTEACRASTAWPCRAGTVAIYNGNTSKNKTTFANEVRETKDVNTLKRRNNN